MKTPRGLGNMLRRTASAVLAAAVSLINSVASGQRVDVWDLPPLRYSDSMSTDKLAVLAGRLSDGSLSNPGAGALEKLRFVLKELQVPESSQILVFSKTSAQSRLIHPANPRCLFFSKDAYVGYVPGGAIEVIVHDSHLGPVFYQIDPGGEQGMAFERDTNHCMSCHGTARTEGVPGVFIRSVFPDVDGRPLLQLGSVTVTHETPIQERWGGYYVTGTSSLPHLGNRVFEDVGEAEPRSGILGDPRGRINAGKYLHVTSDVVALAVLEHQCAVHNLITSASVHYRRARFLAEALDPDSDPDSGQAGRIADDAAEKLVDVLLFKDEADLGDGLEGLAGFQQDYAAQFPKTSSGDSLADFRLYRRIFRNRCSCMIYSAAFRDLPGRVRVAVLTRLKIALSDSDREIAPHLKLSEKRRIRQILSETLEEWDGDR